MSNLSMISKSSSECQENEIEDISDSSHRQSVLFSTESLQEFTEYECSILTSKTLLERHLPNFSNDVEAEISDLSPHIKSILFKPPHFDEKKQIREIKDSKVLSKEALKIYDQSTCSYNRFSIAGKSDFADKLKPSIENLLYTTGFSECMDALVEDTPNMSKSLEDIVKTLNKKIKGTMDEFESKENELEIENSTDDFNLSMTTEVDLCTNENIVRGKFSEDFNDFYKNMMDIIKKGLKEVFQGSNLDESFEMGLLCVTIFKKVKQDTLNDFSDIAGPKYNRVLVEDDLQPVPYISNEIEEETARWINIHSLYDCFMETRKSRKFVEDIHRFIFIGKFEKNSKFDIEYKYREIINTIQEDTIDTCSELTGALILYPNLLIHIVEGSNQAIHSLIKATTKMMITDQFLTTIKIVFNDVDIPVRYFNFWKTVSVKPKRYPPLTEEDITRESKSDFLQKLKDFKKRIIKIGAFSQSLNETNFHEKMQSLADIQLLPSDHILNFILERKYCLTPDDYEKFYLRQYFFKDINEYERPCYFVSPFPLI